jgi:hypothetical protein
MPFKPIGPTILLCCSLLSPGFTYAEVAGQDAPQNAPAQKYKLTVLESPSTSKRVKKGRVSAEAVVKVTDTNNIPIPGITVTFLLPQAGTSGATFGTGALSSVVTTNASGIASSGSLSVTAGSSVSVSVSAAVPGGMLTGTVPITTAVAGAGAGSAGAATGGLSGGVIAGIAAVAVAIGAVAAVAATGGFSGKGGGGASGASSTTSPAVTVTVGAPSSGGITFGPPK